MTRKIKSAQVEDNIDANAIHSTVEGEIAAIAEKATPVSADKLIVEDSEDSDAKKMVQIGNLPVGTSSPLTTKGDIYTYDTDNQRLGAGGDGQLLSADSAEATGLKWIDAPSSSDADAIHDNVDGEIHAITLKDTPVDADEIVIEDSADSWAKKRVALSTLPGGSGTESPLTTKGDLYGFDTDNARIPVGAYGQVLTADNGAALGVDWRDPSPGPGTTKWKYLGQDSVIGLSSLACYQFDGTAAQLDDRTGNGYDLSVNAGDVYQEVIGGCVGLSFGNLSLIAPDTEDLRITGAVTIEAIILGHYGLTSTNQVFLLCSATGESLATNCLYNLRQLEAATLGYYAEYGSGSDIYSTSNTKLVYEPHYVVLTRDASGTSLKFYVDGQLIYSDVVTAPEKDISGNVQRVYIGNNDTGSAAFQGAASSIRISNTELTADQIRNVSNQIMPVGAAPYGADDFRWKYLGEDSLVGVDALACYQFDGTASQLNDRTANGYDFTLKAGSTLQYMMGGRPALWFDGTTAYAVDSTDDTLRITGELTLEGIMLMFPTGATSIAVDMSAVGESLETNILYNFRFGSTDGWYYSMEYGPGTSESESTSMSMRAAPHYMVLTRNASGAVKFYLDGQLIHESAAHPSPEKAGSGNLQKLLMGAYGNFTESFFIGAISSIRISNTEFPAAKIEAIAKEIMGTHGASPLTTKGDIYVYGTENQRLPADGDDGDVLTLDSTEATGLKWAAPTGGSGTGNPLVEEAFSTAGTETPGDPVTFSLTKTPGGGGSADTPSGYHLLVYRNGNKMGYANPPTLYSEYNYDSVNNEIDVLASGSADAYEAIMVEATSSWASYAGHPEDAPPESPSIYDDEFDGTTLDPKWSWTGAGEPTGGSGNIIEYATVSDGRLNVSVINDSSNWASGHRLYQAIPAGVSFSLYMKANCGIFDNYNHTGLYISDAGDTNVAVVRLGYSGLGRGHTLLTIASGGASEGSFRQNHSMLCLCKLTYNHTTTEVKAYASVDGTNWIYIGQWSSLSFTAARMGIYFSAWTGTAVQFISSVEWFRVNLL